MRSRSPNETSPAPPSQRLLDIFGRYADGYLRRHFHSARLLKSGAPEPVPGMPLVIYLNHASWWDPLVCLLLARRFFSQRRSYAPISAEALGRYRFFTKLGFFPVEQNPRGAAQFLRQAEAVLQSDRAALWLTPQGRFVDLRTRPLQFHRGLGHVATRVERAAFMPVALEYVFWEERLPEILVSFGQPLVISADHALGVDDATQLFEVALATVQDHLATAAQRRDPREWHPLLHGRAGVGGVYQFWNRARARLRGERYLAAHSRL
jgi:1-acyl-sn-glycerol-3-phosphate acyltransferase